jgi:hypothetical protein
MRSRRVALLFVGLFVILGIGMLTAPSALASTAAAHSTPSVAAFSCGPADRSNVCNPWGSGVNLRDTPNASGNAVYLDYGTGLFINCYQYGQNINGPWGTSDIWDYVSWTSEFGYVYNGYVSDTYVYTGSNGPPSWVGRCPNGLTGNV